MMNVSTVTVELSELRTRVLGETDTRNIPVYTENVTPERRWPEKVSPGAHVQVVRSDNHRNYMNCCFGVCKIADSVNRSETGSYWICACWIVWGHVHVHDKGALPHAVFRTDYLERLRNLLQSSGQSESPPETGGGSTPKSARRFHRSSRPRRLQLEAVNEGPLLTEQNPADMAGETLFDCRPSVLPVSKTLSALSPGTVADTRGSSSFRPPQETGTSIMDMDTNEISINRIVGFQWDDPGTDLEDELPTPVVSSIPNVAPVIPPAETADPFDRGDGFDLDLAKAEYAAPVTAVVETVFDSPIYTVPEESAVTWIPGFVPVPEAVLVEKGGQTLSSDQPPPHPVPASAATPVVISGVTEQSIPTMPPTPDEMRHDTSVESVRQTDRAKVFVVEATEGSTSTAMCQGAQDLSPDLTREGPFDACEVEPDPGQSPLVLNSMPG